jgi:hypothetical protein
MTEYRQCQVKGGTYFFTVNIEFAFMTAWDY